MSSPTSAQVWVPAIEKVLLLRWVSPDLYALSNPVASLILSKPNLPLGRVGFGAPLGTSIVVWQYRETDCQNYY